MTQKFEAIIYQTRTVLGNDHGMDTIKFDSKNDAEEYARELNAIPGLTLISQSSDLFSIGSKMVFKWDNEDAKQDKVIVIMFRPI